MKDPLKTAVIYQIVLRNFTRDGNFRAATEMLGHCGPPASIPAR